MRCRLRLAESPRCCGQAPTGPWLLAAPHQTTGAAVAEGPRERSTRRASRRRASAARAAAIHRTPRRVPATACARERTATFDPPPRSAGRQRRGTRAARRPAGASAASQLRRAHRQQGNRPAGFAPTARAQAQREEEAARAYNKAIRDAGLEVKRHINAVDATGALMPRKYGSVRSAVVAPDPARAPAETSSKFWGVTWDKSKRQWKAKYKDAIGKTRNIGRFDTQEEAARAVNKAIRDAGLQNKRRMNPVDAMGALVPKPSDVFIIPARAQCS